MTTRARARRTLAAALIVLLPAVLLASAGAARAQSRRSTTTTTTTTVEPTTLEVAPGETAPNGGPLLVPGDVSSGSDAAVGQNSDDSTGTVVALVIAGLLVVALLLALLTYWFWRNTRPTKLEESKPETDATPDQAAAEGKVEPRA